jgi:hypothetical protein
MSARLCWYRGEMTGQRSHQVARCDLVSQCQIKTTATKYVVLFRTLIHFVLAVFGGLTCPSNLKPARVRDCK